METYNQNQNENPNPVSSPKPESGLPAFLRHLLVFILLVGVIAASFWVSFQLGKRLLVPVKKMPERRIEVAIPEPPASIAALQKLEELSKELSKEEQTTAKPAVEKVTPPKKTVSTAKKSKSKYYSIAGTKYYRVQAGVFSDKTNAMDLTNKLNAYAFETFIFKSNGEWLVQVGAFKNKAFAETLQQSLKAKGFESVLVYE